MSGVCLVRSLSCQEFVLSGVCLVRSLSRQEFVFQEFVFSGVCLSGVCLSGVCLSGVCHGTLKSVYKKTGFPEYVRLIVYIKRIVLQAYPCTRVQISNLKKNKTKYIKLRENLNIYALGIMDSQGLIKVSVNMQS